jgi:hypothetical protein
VLRCNSRRFGVVPHGTIVEAAVGLEGVDGPATPLSEEEELEGRAKVGALRGATDVALASPGHDSWAKAQHDGRKGEREPEADVLLGVDHGDLTDKGTDIDEEVEPHINALNGDGRVDDNTLARGEGFDVDVHLTELLDDQGIDVGLCERHC